MLLFALCALPAAVQAQDAYEPDDTAGQAVYMDLGDVQSNHNFHTATDEDWVRFYLVGNTLYDLWVRQTGTNVDVKVDVYWEAPDGGLAPVLEGVDARGLGYTNELVRLDPVGEPEVWPEGFYAVRLSSAATNGGWGGDSEYDVELVEPSGGGRLIVVAGDVMGSNRVPVGAVATLDGVSNIAFGTSTSVSFDNVSAGLHTVWVTPPPGYVKQPDPALANQENNPTNILYGNPKTKSVAESKSANAVFLFVPVVRVTGTVRDGHTGEAVAGAKIAFVATSGSYTNPVFDGYPENTTYQVPWLTGPDGAFPANVILPTTNWNLRLSKAEYVTNWTVPALTNLVRGTTNQLATKWLLPVDVNTNGIRDTWEASYFGALTSATNDPDGDGLNNREEYLTGTVPTNGASVLESDAVLSNGQWTLTWPVVSGRTYRVASVDALADTNWLPTAGPWTATGQVQMSYAASAAGTGAFLRVEVPLP